MLSLAEKHDKKCWFSRDKWVPKIKKRIESLEYEMPMSR